MENSVSEFMQKTNALKEIAFTDALVQNELMLDAEFNNLEVEVDHLMIYKDGGIMGVAVDLTEKNKSILSKFIKDFEAYDALIDLEFASDKSENQTDLISIIYYVEKNHKITLKYDKSDEYFYIE